MCSCEDYLSRIDLYLDGELRGEELTDFKGHVNECSSCQIRLTERRRLLERIRATRPLCAPSPEFRAAMAVLLASSPVHAGSVPSSRHPASAKEQDTPFWLLWRRSRSIPALIGCMLLIAVIVTVWRLSVTQTRVNAFLDIAVDTHRREVAGHLPLDVRSNSPTEVSTWFAQRVRFHFRLPRSQEKRGQEKRYELIGGRLMHFKGTDSAYVAYRMRDQLISLVVTSASTARASGGEETVAGRLTFHTHRKGEYHIVTWSTHNLTYALVSGLSLPATQSCVVCHASTNGKTQFGSLKTLNTHSVDRSRPKLGVMLASPAPRREALQISF
jgi:anti-sigma factor RsiW